MSRKAPLVVGLDPSWASFGIAHHDGTTSTVKTTNSLRQSVRRKVLIAAVTSACWKADLVVIESPSYGSVQGREFLGYLGHSVRDTLADLGIPFLDIAPTKLKKWATGDGRAKKPQMKAAAIAQLGLPDTITHDEADAAWLRAAGLHLLGVSTRIPPSVNAEALSDIQLRREK